MTRRERGERNVEKLGMREMKHTRDDTHTHPDTHTHTPTHRHTQSLLLCRECLVVNLCGRLG